MHHNIGDFTFQARLSLSLSLCMYAAAYALLLGVHLIPVIYQEAFDYSGRILNIIVSPKNNITDPPRLLNYLTAPHVLVWSAVVCSCSAPGVFDASPLLVRSTVYMDVMRVCCI